MPHAGTSPLLDLVIRAGQFLKHERRTRIFVPDHPDQAGTVLKIYRRRGLWNTMRGSLVRFRTEREFDHLEYLRGHEIPCTEATGWTRGYSPQHGFYEVLAIRHNENGSLVYTAHPVGQATTAFTATVIGDNSVVFENADHDYPQRIRYTREADRLRATISLLDDSRPASFDKVACH